MRRFNILLVTFLYTSAIGVSSLFLATPVSAEDTSLPATLGGTGSINFGGVQTGPGVNTGGSSNAGGSQAPAPLNFVPLIKDYPQIENMQNADIPSFLNTLFSITVGIAATLAILMVAVGGIEYMMTESPYKLGDAKERIGMAIFGLLIVLTSVLLLKTINPKIVSLELFQPSAPPTIPKASDATVQKIEKASTQAPEPQSVPGQIVNLVTTIPAKIYDLTAPPDTPPTTVLGTVADAARGVVHFFAAPAKWFNNASTPTPPPIPANP